ncbi:MAG: hypothetical protein HC906_10580 [Bacteroidales bacterium]|nr:hypothetical protein [Bacteroidales bacterium]
MKANIVTIGNEILIGQIIDTNSAYIAKELNMAGISVNRIISISDTKDDIFHALNETPPDVQCVILTGGLGPTNDDVTKKH